MGQVLHGRAMTTEAIRRAIYNSQESLRAHAKRCGMNPKTVARWRKRTSVAGLATGPKHHPLRAVKSLAEEVLAGLNDRFEGLYSRVCRPSIPPEMRLRATLLQAFFAIRPKRMLMDQINYNLLFRWFVGLSMDAPAFPGGLLALPQVKRLLSNEHFSVDGTLIDAWASMKSFQRRDGSGAPPGPSGGGGRNATRDFHADKCSNQTYASVPDPDARLCRKSDGQPSRLSYVGHVLSLRRFPHERDMLQGL